MGLKLSIDYQMGFIDIHESIACSLAASHLIIALFFVIFVADYSLIQTFDKNL